MATTELDRSAVNSGSSPSTADPRRQRLVKRLAIMVILGVSLAAFLTLDWLHTAAMQRRHAAAAADPDPCRMRDPIRHHAFKPDCTAVNYWGTDEYKISTNNLGFRDEQIRNVPLSSTRPRVLLLGNSYIEGKTAWSKSIAGKLTAQLPQYDFLNGGVDGYSPSNFLNTTRLALAEGVQIDEVIVFLDNSAVQLEAAFYRDINSGGAVTALASDEQHSAATVYARFRKWLGLHFSITFQLLRLAERSESTLVRHGFYHLPGDYFGDPFDMEVSGWSYRSVNQREPFAAGYAPLGVQGGMDRAQQKMTLLWQELAERNIPISVVVYPHLAQVVHDTAESREVELWQKWCQGKCKRFVSVFPDFYAARDRCPSSQPGCWYSQLFIFGDIHYNAGGNTLVATAVAKSLQTDPAVKLNESRDRIPEPQIPRLAAIARDDR
jgi:hypothetical protein